MNFLINTISIIGILISCMSYTQAMENSQNGGGEKTQYNDNINNFTDVRTISARIGGPFIDNDLFTCDATLAEIVRYPILNYYLNNIAIANNKPTDYYLKRMHELISSIMQFKQDIQDHNNGYYENYTKHKIKKAQMQDIFCKVWSALIYVCTLNNDKPSPNKNEFMYAMRNLLKSHQDKLRNNALNYTNDDLLKLYNTFSDILKKYNTEK